MERAIPHHDQRSEEDAVHLSYLRQALSEARKCIHVPTAFCVGCVIVVYPDEATNLQTVHGSDTSSKTTEEGKRKGIVLSTGYSRELPGNTHAEANALTKASNLSIASPPSILLDTAVFLTPSNISSLLHTATVYTTLEPCSVRTSGLAPCANALVDAGVKEVVLGVKEPDDFVTCEGVKVLETAGVQVRWVKGLEEECLRVARGDFS